MLIGKKEDLTHDEIQPSYLLLSFVYVLFLDVFLHTILKLQLNVITIVTIKAS